MTSTRDSKGALPITPWTAARGGITFDAPHKPQNHHALWTEAFESAGDMALFI